MSQSQIFISKRCPYSRKLLMLLQQRPDLKGDILITCIDDEPFPNVIKQVPSMIVGNEIWDCDKIFQELQQSGNQETNTPQTNDKKEDNQEIVGICENGLCSFSSLDDSLPMDNFMFASIDDPGPTSIDTKQDGYMDKNSRSKNMDNDYEKLMEQRGEMMPNKRPIV